MKIECTRRCDHVWDMDLKIRECGPHQRVWRVLLYRVSVLGVYDGVFNTAQGVILGYKKNGN